MADSHLVSIVSNAVAAVKEAPADAAAVEAADDIVGTAEPEPAADTSADEGTADTPAADELDHLGNPIEKPAAKPVVEEKPKAEEKPAEVIESDDFDTVPAKDAAGRTNRIPHPRVRVMVDTAVKKATTPLVTELTTLRPRVTDYEARLNKVGEVENTLFNHPKQMLEILRTIPGYEELLNPAAVLPDTPPDPDVLGADGKPAGYSAEGLQKLLKWTTDKATADALKQAEAKLGRRLEPFEKGAANAKREAQQQQRINGTLQEAATWPQFKDREAEILKVLEADSEQAKTTGKFQHNLLSAYHQVVFGAVTTDRQKIREELIAEMKAAPAATSAGSAGRKPEPIADDPNINERERLTNVVHRALARAKK